MRVLFLSQQLVGIAIISWGNMNVVQILHKEKFWQKLLMSDPRSLSSPHLTSPALSPQINRRHRIANVDMRCTIITLPNIQNGNRLIWW
jgi:hypothetical protein